MSLPPSLVLRLASRSVGFTHSQRGTAPFEIVALYPHVHDHCTNLRLMSSATGLVHSFTPGNSNSHPVAHDAVGAGPPTPWHVHGSGTAGHLPVNGLTTWVPAPLTVFTTPNGILWMEGDFNNPHPHSIDNMLVGQLFFK